MFDSFTVMCRWCACSFSFALICSLAAIGQKQAVVHNTRAMSG